MKKTPVIIDCDTGLDDAIALALGAHSDKLNILAVTTTAGNSSLDNTTRNTLNVLNALGREDIPVAVGQDRPLERPLMKASGVHGTNGLRGVEFKENYSGNLVKNISSWDYMYKTIKEYKEKVTIVALAPLTNVALLLIKHPDIKERIKEIVFMGTSFHTGNPTSVATFNVLVDPEAFRLVAFSGVRLVSCPLETVREATLCQDDIKYISSLNTPSAKLVSALLSGYGLQNIREDEIISSEGEEELSEERIERAKMCGVGLPDPLTLGYVIAPDLFNGHLYYCDVECKGELTTGMTLIDMEDYYLKKEEERNLFFLDEVDNRGFINLFIKELEKENE